MNSNTKKTERRCSMFVFLFFIASSEALLKSRYKRDAHRAQRSYSGHSPSLFFDNAFLRTILAWLLSAHIQSLLFPDRRQDPFRCNR